MINKLKILYSKLDVHTAEVIRKSSASTVVKVAGMAIGLLVSVFLGRTIGADGLGIINLSNRIVNILLVVGLLGMRQVIIKEVAIAHNKKDFAYIGNVMHTAYWMNGGITLVLSVIMIFFSPWLANTVFNEPRLQYPLMIALVAMTPQVFSRIFSSALIGYKKIWQSNLVDQTLSIFITGILLVIIWFFNLKLTVILVAICYAIGRVGVTISVGYFFKKISSFKVKKISKTKFKNTTSFFLVEISQVLQTSVGPILLGLFSNATEIGLYSIANRIALISIFFLNVTNSIVSPKIATFFSNHEIDKMEKLIQQITLGLLSIGFIFLLFFILAGKYILNFWGKEFVDAYWILIIIAVGQLVNNGTGVVGAILLMTGHENIQSKISLASSLLSIIFGIVLINLYGALGAAFSSSFIIIISNIFKVIYVKKITGIKPLRYI